MKIDLNRLKKYKQEGLLRSQSHPTLPLTIWNYTNKVQYEYLWDDLTMLCRALVLDDKGVVIAHPFEKFFNYSELKPKNKVPKGDFVVLEKLDGSYIQVFWYKGQRVISSKGSFTSVQANWAIELWENKYEHLDFNTNLNYIFELIHPNNRIVVDYGEEFELYLLGTLNKDGTEVFQDHSFKTPKIYSLTNLEEMQDLIKDSEEGFVIWYVCGQRMKIKGEEYLRLHRIVTHTSSKDIWETLKGNGDIGELIDRTPDEWTNWVYRTIGELYVKFNKIERTVQIDLEYGKNELSLYFKSEGKWWEIGSRKDIAKYVNSCKYPNLLFNLLDNKKETVFKENIWKLVKPDFQKGFSI